ncbi:MAG: hypothetical protein Ct9H90mP22_6450 [Gammaproteobacteria bacterium]|nr:MAG: hypothetical protein Ct9H90mP22_6450 [Gammaproteobacteria bacterium]
MQRGAIAAQELNIFDQYFECVIKAMWENDKNISDVEVLKSLLSESGFDVEAIMSIVTSQACKDKLIEILIMQLKEVHLEFQPFFMIIKYFLVKIIFIN